MLNNPNTAPSEVAPAQDERPSQALRAAREAQKTTEELLTLLVTPIVLKQQQADTLLNAMHSSISDLSKQFREMTNLFKAVQAQGQEHISQTVAAIGATLNTQVTELETRLEEAAKLHVDTVDAHKLDNASVSEELKNFADVLQSGKGPSHVGFDIQEPYAEGTLGYTVKTLLKMLEKATSSFVNLGATAELYVAARTITVTQTLNAIRCPASVPSVDLEMIRGGVKNDLAILTSIGEINLKVSGNMRLKSEYTLIAGRSIVLKKTEDGWDELWRSH